jgi:hypothetical protein
MSDLVRKYQHYFNESVKLQETVNEQLAYITELEDAILSLDEAYRMTPERDAILKREKNKAQKTIDDNAEKSYEEGDRHEMTADEDKKLTSAFDRKDRISKIQNKTVKEETLSEISNELRISYLKAVEKKVADGKNWFGGKPEGRFSRLDATPGDAETRRRKPGIARALRQLGNTNNT